MDLKAKHSLGQNFLKDDNVLNRIIDSVTINDNEELIEIGPGMGALTAKLKIFNVPLTCFEIDLRTKDYLDKLVDAKTKIVYEDFMSVDLSKYLDKSKKYHVVANIPYYITTPIIERLINSGYEVITMTLMVQKEVADRLSSRPSNKEYGYFTAYLNYYYDVNKLFNVDKKCFSPVPKVDSAIIKLISNRHKCSDENKLFKILKDSFMMKRKNLRNNLRSYDLNKVEDILKNYGHSLNNRAEDISIDEFIDIAENL